jgi:hypothetical protein
VNSPEAVQPIVIELSVWKLLAVSWNILANHLFLAISTAILVWVVPLVMAALFLVTTNCSATLCIIFLIYWILVTPGFIKILLELSDGRNPTLVQIFSNYRLAWSCLIGNILFSLCIFIGLAFFTVPGLVSALRLGFFGFAIVDTKRGPIQALNHSFSITRRSVWFILRTLLAASVVAYILMFCSLFPLLLMLFLTGSYTQSLMNAHIAIFIILLPLFAIPAPITYFYTAMACTYRLLNFETEGVKRTDDMR